MTFTWWSPSICREVLGSIGIAGSLARRGGLSLLIVAGLSFFAAGVDRFFGTLTAKRIASEDRTPRQERYLAITPRTVRYATRVGLLTFTAGISLFLVSLL